MIKTLKARCANVSPRAYGLICSAISITVLLSSYAWERELDSPWQVTFDVVIMGVLGYVWGYGAVYILRLFGKKKSRD